MVNGIVTVAAVITLLCPDIAFADSDGFYCVGKGFVAYEMSFSEAAGKHILHIVHVAQGSGISRMSPIALEDFQVHGMRCRENGVDLDGWTTRYSVELSTSGQPTVTSIPAALDPKATSPQLNLAMLARPGVTDIPSDGIAGEFQLVIAETTRKTTSGIERYTITQILRRDLKAPMVRQVVATETLYAGVSLTGGQ